MPFHVGQKVTLKKDRAGWRNIGKPHPPIKFPTLGEVYTVIKCSIGDCPGGPADQFECLWLAEFPDVPPGHSGPAAYEAAAFRPVVERKTDISVFTAILDRCNVEA